MSYWSLHRWVERQLGKPMCCSNCKDSEKSRYHWANISGEYKKDISDWMRLCVSCHKIYDLSRLGGKSPNKEIKTHCKHGHEYTQANTRWRTLGLKSWRVCRKCQYNFRLSYKLRTEN